MTLPTEREKGLMLVAIVDCMAGLTGLRPPAESEQVPPEMRPHIDRLMFEMWRIATSARPEAARIIIRTNADGSLDEAILINGLANFHLEQMDDGHWWMALTLDKQRIDINLTARGKIKANVSDEGEVKLIDDANAFPSPPRRELCDDCGCEADCITYGCTKEYRREPQSHAGEPE